MEKIRIGNYLLQKQSVAEYEEEFEVKLQEHIPGCDNVKFIYQVVQLGKSAWYGEKLIIVGASRELMLEFTNGSFGSTVNYGYTYCTHLPGTFLDCLSAMFTKIALF